MIIYNVKIFAEIKNIEFSLNFRSTACTEEPSDGLLNCVLSPMSEPPLSHPSDMLKNLSTIVTPLSQSGLVVLEPGK